MCILHESDALLVTGEGRVRSDDQAKWGDVLKFSAVVCYSNVMIQRKRDVQLRDNFPIM